MSGVKFTVCSDLSFYFIWWKLLHRWENWRFLAFNDMKDATRFYIGTKGSTFLFLLKNLWPLMFCHCKINIFLCCLEIQWCDWKVQGKVLCIRVTDLSFGIASVDILPPPVKSCHHIQVWVVVHRQDNMFGVWQSQKDRGWFHRTHQNLVPKTKR